VGDVPTGSADPFGLRRDATGVVRIVTEGDLPLRIVPLIQVSLRGLAEQGYGDSALDGVKEQVLDFLGQRLATLLRESGVRYDLVDAALAVGIDDITQAEKRARALHVLQAREEFLPTVIASTRPINIAKDFEGGDVDPDLFREDAERDLWSAYQEVLAEAEKAALVHLFHLFSTKLRAPIDRYFDDVLVMAESEKLRRNRLAMCWNLAQLFRRIADFSLVVQA